MSTTTTGSVMTAALSHLMTPWAVQVGLTCCVAQIVLTLIFSSGALFGPGPWQQMPGFTAHQIITIPVLTYLAVHGLYLQWTQEPCETATDRLTEPRHLHLSEFVFGLMMFWDIPTGLCTRALREAPMIVHHVMMAMVAALALGAGSTDPSSHNLQPIVGYYAPFFFGVIEWSSLPLIIVDIFHPKHKAWHAYLTSSNSSSGSNIDTTSKTTISKPPPPPAWLHQVNAIARLVFAASFIVLRTICFPYVSIVGVWYDVWTVYDLPLDERRGVPNGPLVTMAALNLLFSCLQLYWGSLLIQQILKLLRKKDKKDDKKAS